MWGWALAGTIILPALLGLTTSSARWLVAAMACVIGAATMFAGGLSAFRRNESWRFAVLAWGVAFAAAVTTFIAWGSYSEPLAQPGDLNVVTLEPGSVGSYRGITISPEWTYGLWRLVVSLSVFAAIVGILDGWRRSTLSQGLISGILLGAAWVVSLLPVVVVAVASLYAGDLLSNFLPRAGTDFAFIASIIVGGAACGLIFGSVTERILRRGES